MEILRQHQHPSPRRIVAIGWPGGLISGFAASHSKRSPRDKGDRRSMVDSDAMILVRRGGYRIDSIDVGLFLMGTAVKMSARRTCVLTRKLVAIFVRGRHDVVCCRESQRHPAFHNADLEPRRVEAFAGLKKRRPAPIFTNERLVAQSPLFWRPT